MEIKMIMVNILADKNKFIDDLLNNKKVQPTYYIGGNTYTSLNKIKILFE